MSDEVKLIDRTELLKRYPAFRGRGKNPKWRLDWLIRMKRLPIVRIGKLIFFDPREVDDWISASKIPVANGNE